MKLEDVILKVYFYFNKFYCLSFTFLMYTLKAYLLKFLLLLMFFKNRVIRKNRSEQIDLVFIKSLMHMLVSIRRTLLKPLACVANVI